VKDGWHAPSVAYEMHFHVGAAMRNLWEVSWFRRCGAHTRSRIIERERDVKVDQWTFQGWSGDQVLVSSHDGYRA
jgi:hypothetical protein